MPCGRHVADRHGLACAAAGLPGLRAGTGIAGGTAAGASLGCPGQEGTQAGSSRGSSAIAGAFLQVAGQQAERLDAVPGGGGGDGPDIGGQVSGPLRFTTNRS